MPSPTPAAVARPVPGRPAPPRAACLTHLSRLTRRAGVAGAAAVTLGGARPVVPPPTATPAAPRAAASIAPSVAPSVAPTTATSAAAPARRAAGGELRVRGADGAWRPWWRAADAPARWIAADARLAGRVAWRAAAPGVEVGELALSGPGEAWRVRAVLVRLDPARQRLALDANAGDGHLRPWDVARAPAAASVALNAGMFDDAGPWGWVVHGGRELQAPGAGALASAVVVGADGRVRVVGADSTAALRAAARRGEVAEAVQGYPTLLDGDGAVPAALRPAGAGVRRGADAPDARPGIDLEHRDARLAVGELRDGRVLVALTRFDALHAVAGDLLGGVPLGLTVPEAAALMGALGARRAVLLDGGLSAQLLVRGPGGRRVWGGLRRVPLGIVATPRPPAAPPAARPPG